jgi:hypothetical protein
MPGASCGTPTPSAILRADSTVGISQERMTPTAVLTFMLVAGVVWGGLLVILVTAAREEGRKRREG